MNRTSSLTSLIRQKNRCGFSQKLKAPIRSWPVDNQTLQQDACDLLTNLDATWRGHVTKKEKPTARDFFQKKQREELLGLLDCFQKWSLISMMSWEESNNAHKKKRGEPPEIWFLGRATKRCNLREAMAQQEPSTTLDSISHSMGAPRTAPISKNTHGTMRSSFWVFLWDSMVLRCPKWIKSICTQSSTSQQICHVKDSKVQRVLGLFGPWKSYIWGFRLKQ